MKQEDGARTMHAFQPVVTEYEVLRVRLTYNLGTFYLHPSQKEEIEEKLSAYLAFGKETGYQHPILDITLIRMTEERINQIVVGKTFEEKMVYLTTSVDELVAKIEMQTYDRCITHTEMSQCKEEIERLQRNNEAKIKVAIEQFEILRRSVISTHAGLYHRKFAEGVQILTDLPITKQAYQKHLMELAVAIINHVWGKVTRDTYKAQEHEKVLFLTEHVLPAIMKRG